MDNKKTNTSRMQIIGKIPESRWQWYFTAYQWFVAIWCHILFGIGMWLAPTGLLANADSYLLQLDSKALGTGLVITGLAMLIPTRNLIYLGVLSLPWWYVSLVYLVTTIDPTTNWSFRIVELAVTIPILYTFGLWVIAELLKAQHDAHRTD